jgi:hypothetical protein
MTLLTLGTAESQGPLGAPVLNTADPQILLEEGEEEEDATFQVGEVTPDEESPGGRKPSSWDSQDANDQSSRNPPWGTVGDDDNPWNNNH